ncbi:MAG: hypothetical protein LBR36_06050 [Bacteroidales bacterium]|jgi:hypothetical protein|nr:hypothetical protein [Bacteroidales bacterium]
MFCKKLIISLLATVTGGILCLCCQKTPLLGEYDAVFTGYYTSDTMRITFTTTYQFEIVSVKQTEIGILETQSKTRSTLTKESDTKISGKIAIINAYQPEPSGNSPILNTIDIEGVYDKTSIAGTFSSVVYSGYGTFPAQGEFRMEKH